MHPLLCQVGDDVIRPYKFCRGRDARYASEDPFIQSINVLPYNLESTEFVLGIRST